ncbi:MAG: hypothetical protein MI867_03640, partial [Pseudomonadales bacterium]|nr:hypothetical protein [Pseudomonadales bacterium]
MNYSSKSNEEIITLGRTVVKNTLNNDDIKTPLLEWGLEETTLQEGARLLKEAEEWVDSKDFRYGDQIANTGNLGESLDKSLTVFQGHRKIASRLVGTDRNHRQALGVDAPLANRPMDAIRQAKQFYQNGVANPEIVARLSIMGLNATKLQEGLDRFLALEEEELKQENSKGLAQQATQERDQAISNLIDWLAAFEEVCKLVFVKEPERQKMERLGFPALTYKKKKNTTTTPTPDDSDPPVEQSETPVEGEKPEVPPAAAETEGSATTGTGNTT